MLADEPGKPGKSGSLSQLLQAGLELGFSRLEGGLHEKVTEF